MATVHGERLQPGVDDAQELRRVLPPGLRIGLITNPTGVSSSPVSVTSIDILHRAPFNLTALFAPEHGLRGDKPPGAGDDQPYVDPYTGVTVYSIYNLKDKIFAPTAEMLRLVDVIVCDLQDVGARPFTYISTVALSMRAAAENGKKFVVLDRFNPIGGAEADVDGPMLQDPFRSFIGIWRLPLRHGMTMGEMALLINAEMLAGKADLTVIKARNWQGRQALPAYEGEGSYGWINPSPNLPSFESAVLYPGTVLLEGVLNVSLGRGTAQPFSVVGAPFVDDPYKLLAKIQAMRAQDAKLDSLFASVELVATYFIPTSSVHQGKQCAGVKLVITDRARAQQIRSIPITITIIHAMLQLYGFDRIGLSKDEFNLRAGNSDLFACLVLSVPISAIVESWQQDRAAFLARRSQYLLYK